MTIERKLQKVNIVGNNSLLVSIALNCDDAPESYYDNEALPGAIIKLNDNSCLIAYRNSSQIIGDADGFIPVVGSNMVPIFNPGDLVAIKKLKFDTLLIPGNCYFIVDLNNLGILTRIERTEGYKELKCISANVEQYPSFTINIREINAIFRIEAVLIRK